MFDASPNPTETVTEGASCAMRPDGCRAEQAVSGGGLLSGGCCPPNAAPSDIAMGRTARRSRAAAGLMFLAIAGGLSSRRLPGSVAMWPTSLVPTWFGISHLVAGMTGYQGCPELGAIPSVMLGRPVGTSCELWQRVDRWVGSSDSGIAQCC